MFKKTILFTAALLVGNAFASSAPEMAKFSPYVYGDINIGYAYHPWQYSFGSFGEGESWNNGNGGFAYGLDIGYSFYRYLGIEAAYYRLPTAKLKNLGGNNYNFTTNTAYLALKGVFPIMNQLDVFAKLGFGYQNASVGSSFNQANGYKENNYIGPMFGLGAEYVFSNNVTVDAQYLYLQGDIHNVEYASGRTQIVPNANLFLVGVGYRFSV